MLHDEPSAFALELRATEWCENTTVEVMSEDLLAGVVTLEGTASIPSLDDRDRQRYRPTEHTARHCPGVTAVPYSARNTRETGARELSIQSENL